MLCLECSSLQQQTGNWKTEIGKKLRNVIVVTVVVVVLSTAMAMEAMNK